MKHILNILFFLIISVNFIGQNESKDYKKAMKFKQEENFTKAIKFYTKDLEKNKKTNFANYANRGLCYFNIKQYEKSIKDLLVIDSIHPGDAKTNEFLGVAFTMLNQHENAAKHLQNSVDFGHQNPESLFKKLGTSYYFSGNNVLAKKYLEIALKNNPSDDFILNNLAWANLDTEPEVSCKLFHKAYDMDSLNVPNINNLGYSHLLCGDLEIAFEFFLKAESLDPTNSFIYRNYGLYYMYKEDKAKACEHLQKAKDLKIVENYGFSYIEELEIFCAK